MAEKTKEKVERGAATTPQQDLNGHLDDDGRVDYCLPMNLLTNDEFMEACVNGKVYQIKCGENVRIPKELAEVLDNAIEQKKKIEAMVKEREMHSVEIV